MREKGDSFPKSCELIARLVKTNLEGTRERRRGNEKSRRGEKWKTARRRIVLATSGIVKYDRLLVKWDQNIGCRAATRPFPSLSLSLFLYLYLSSSLFLSPFPSRSAFQCGAHFCSFHANNTECPWNDHPTLKSPINVVGNVVKNGGLSRPSIQNRGVID